MLRVISTRSPPNPGALKTVALAAPAICTEDVTSHLFDINFSCLLWDTAHLSLDYNISTTQDFATPALWGANNALTTTFSWPLVAALGLDKKLVLSPYLSYYFSDGKATYLDRRYLSASLDGDYFLTPDSKLNLSGEYRDNMVSDPLYCGFGDEYRIMVSYKTVSGF